VLADGNLAFVARADRQVKVRGHRVELEEVEAALLSLASVEEAAVFTVPDGEGSSALRAVVVVGVGARELSPDQVSAIRNVVASSVPNLKPEKVTVTDTANRTLAAGSDGQSFNSATAETAKSSCLSTLSSRLSFRSSTCR